MIQSARLAVSRKAWWNTIRNVKTEERQRSRSAIRKAVLLCCGSALFFFQIPYPFLRLAWPVLNDLVGVALAAALPLITMIAIFRIGRWWSKAVVILATLPVLLFYLVFALGASVLAVVYGHSGHDASFERFSELQWKDTRVGLYRTNGGATTDYGVVIRHEKTLIPGLLLVRNVDSIYPCYSFDGTQSEQGIGITDGHSNCRALSGRHHEYQLKKFVYF